MGDSGGAAEGGSPRLLVLTGVAAAAATLLKGPVGPLLMVPPATVYLRGAVC